MEPTVIRETARVGWTARLLQVCRLVAGMQLLLLLFVLQPFNELTIVDTGTSNRVGVVVSLRPTGKGTCAAAHGDAFGMHLLADEPRDHAFGVIPALRIFWDVAWNFPVLLRQVPSPSFSSISHGSTTYLRMWGFRSGDINALSPLLPGTQHDAGEVLKQGRNVTGEDFGFLSKVKHWKPLPW